MSLLGLRKPDQPGFERVINFVREQAVSDMEARRKNLNDRRLKLDELEEGIIQRTKLIMAN